MRIFGLLLILLVSLGCEDRLGETSVKSLSGKSYSKNNGLLFTTNLIKDFNTAGAGTTVDFGNHLTVDGGIFYTTNHPLFGDELFFWDQVSGDAHMVEDLNFGGANSNIKKMKQFGNYVYFFATSASEGIELRRVDINSPYSIESFDMVAGLGVLPEIAADNTLSSTDYIISNNHLIIFNQYEGLAVINLSTLNYQNITDNNGYSLSDFGNILGGIELNGNFYFKAFYQSNWQYFILENNMTDFNLLSGSLFSLADNFGTVGMRKHKDAMLLPGRANDGLEHLFAHKGSSSDGLILINYAGRYPGGNTFNSATKIHSTAKYVYMYSRNSGGSNKHFKITLDTSNFTNTATELALDTAIPTQQFTIGDNYCFESDHGTAGASVDITCYRGDEDDAYLVKTNYSSTLSANINIDFADSTNGSMNFESLYQVQANKLYFIAKDDTGFRYIYRLDIDNLVLEQLKPIGITPVSLQVSPSFLLANSASFGEGYDLDLNSNVSSFATEISIGNGVSSNSSNPKIIYDSENFILFTRDDQSLASTPYTNNFAGAIYVYDRINDTTYTLTHPDGGSVYFESINPGNGRKAMIKAFGNKVIIEASLNNSTGDYRRAPLIFNTTNGAYGLVHKFFGTSDYVDIGYFYDIFRVGSKFLIYCQDEDMGSPAFFEITTVTEITSVARDSSNIRTFPILSGDKLYFPYGVGNETVHAIKMNALGTGLEMVQVGPSGQVLPTGVVARAFATDDKFLYYNIEQSGDKLYFLEIENPLNHGFVLDSGNAQLIGQSFLKREGKLLSTDISLISKPLYQIDTSSGVPRASFIETIENEMFYNKGNDSVYKIGSEIKRITPQGEIVSLINEFSNYSDPTCSALAFTNGVDDDNFIYEFGVLALRGNGAAVDELCFFGTNGDAINFATFGYNLNGLKVKSIVDRGEKIFITITKPSYQTDLIVIDALDSSFEVIKTKSLNYGIQPFGYVYGDESIIYCDEDLSRVDMANNSYEIINQAIQCDPRALHRPLSQSGLWFSGIDRDNYVGYELYEVK